MTDVRRLCEDAFQLNAARLRLTLQVLRAKEAGSDMVAGVAQDDLRLLLQALETSASETEAAQELRDVREDRAYANGAKQALTIAEQSMDSARRWAAEGYGGRITPIVQPVR